MIDNMNNMFDATMATIQLPAVFFFGVCCLVAWGVMEYQARKAARREHK